MYFSAVSVSGVQYLGAMNTDVQNILFLWIALKIWLQCLL